MWFYDVEADGLSLDDKRNALLPDAKLGPVTAVRLSDDDHAKNNLPDVLVRWKERHGKERPRTAQSFAVLKDEVAAHTYDLSPNRYKEIVRQDAAHVPASKIIIELKAIDGTVDLYWNHQARWVSAIYPLPHRA